MSFLFHAFLSVAALAALFVAIAFRKRFTVFSRGRLVLRNTLADVGSTPSSWWSLCVLPNIIVNNDSIDFCWLNLYFMVRFDDEDEDADEELDEEMEGEE